MHVGKIIARTRAPQESFFPVPVNGRPIKHSNNPDINISVWDYAVKVRDGYLLMKRLYKGKLNTPPKNGNNVVVLLHGFGTNGNIFREDQKGEILNLEEIDSMAMHLAAEGKDVFIVHYLGRRIDRRYIAKTYGLDFTYIKPNKVSFDHLVQIDIPNVLDLISIIIGEPVKAVIVGHSMGGVVAYAYKGFSLDPRVAKICTLGSMVRMDHDADLLPVFLDIHLVATGLGAIEFNPVSLVAGNFDSFAALMARMPQGALDLLPIPGINLISGVNRNIREGFLRRVMEPVSLYLLMFHAQMLIKNKFATLEDLYPNEIIGWLHQQYSSETLFWVMQSLLRMGVLKPFRAPIDQDIKVVDYGKEMAGIDCPVLVIAGTEDKIAPPHCVEPAISMLPPGRVIFKKSPATHLGLIASPVAQVQIIPDMMAFINTA